MFHKESEYINNVIIFGGWVNNIRVPSWYRQTNNESPQNLLFLCLLRAQPYRSLIQYDEFRSKFYIIQKISFKLKEDKNQHIEKYGDNNKNVQLSFYDMEN